MKHPRYGALHTDRQSDMAFFFLRMRLLASPFGLAITTVVENLINFYYSWTIIRLGSCKLSSVFCIVPFKLKHVSFGNFVSLISKCSKGDFQNLVCRDYRLPLDGCSGKVALTESGKRYWYRSGLRYLTVTKWPSNHQPWSEWYTLPASSALAHLM